MTLIASITLSILGALFVLGWLFAWAECSDEGSAGPITAVMGLITIFLVVAGLIFGLIQIVT